MPNSRRRFKYFALLFAAVAATALAQPYPNRPVRIITPYPPGGGVDATARIIGQALSEELKQQFIIDNRPGASGRIGTDVAAHAAPDGYTILLGNVGPNAILPASGMKLPYDGVTDFAPVSLVAVSGYALTVHPSFPVRSVKELIALAKKEPGKIAFGSTGVGGGPHLAGELLMSMTGIKLLHVPYKGGGPVMTALLSGEVPMSFSTLPTVLPFQASGKLRIVAVTTPKRWPTEPKIPAIAETVPGYAVTQWYGLLAPAKTDPAIISELNRAVAKAVTTDQVKRALSSGGSIAQSTTPQEFQALIKKEIAKWKAVFKARHLKLH